MKPHIRGVVLEGISHAGKTSVLKALKQAQAAQEDSERSILVLGEHYSQQLQNINGDLTSLSCDEHAELLNDRLSGIEKLNDWAAHLGDASRRSRGLFFVLERFHLNHRSKYSNSAHIGEIEERLSNLGCSCFLLTVLPEYVSERIQYRADTIIEDRNIEHVCNDWIEQQEKFVALKRESRVTTNVIDTSERTWDLYASNIMDLMVN